LYGFWRKFEKSFDAVWKFISIVINLCYQSIINLKSIQMGHQLKEINGQVPFMNANTDVPAWHGLGQTVKEAQTADKAIELAGLDFDVEKTAAYMKIGDEEVMVPRKYVTYRQDTKVPFGVVGEQYTILQNRDAFGFFDSIVGSDMAIYETAGALKDGQKVFITAKLPDYIKVGNGDMIEQYLFLTNTHDGSGAVTVAFTPVRIVCANTLNMALRSCKNRVSIRHTSGVHSNLMAAKKVMGMVDVFSDHIEAAYNRLAGIKVTDKKARKLIEDALAPKGHVKGEEFNSRFVNQIDGIMEFMLSDDTQQFETCKGTAFGVLNGVTGFFQHKAKYNVGGEFSLEKKVESITAGTALWKGQQVFDKLIALRG